mgnify:FL=1
MQSNQPEQDKSDIVQQDHHRYQVTGTLDFSTVPALMRRAVSILKGHINTGHKNTGAGKASAVEFDPDQVADCNSAALALMLEMARDARSKNIELHFDNLPASLLTIAKAYGVESEIRDICK